MCLLFDKIKSLTFLRNIIPPNYSFSIFRFHKTKVFNFSTRVNQSEDTRCNGKVGIKDEGSLFHQSQFTFISHSINL